MVKLVSDNDERDIALHQTGRRFARELRELTANLMRITRGAGKPEEIEQQAQRVVEAAAAYRAAGGEVPVAAANALSIDPRAAERAAWPLAAEERALGRAENVIIGGALQIVASRLLHQLTQERRGDGELHQGYSDRKAALEAMRHGYSKPTTRKNRRV